MKNRLLVMFVAVVCMVSFQAMADSASGRNAALDTAFDNDNLTLVRAEFPTVSAEDFEFNYEMLQNDQRGNPADLLAEIKTYISSGSGFHWLSLSPSGNSGLLMADEPLGDKVNIGFYQGKFHFIFPCHQRGVEDINGNLDEIASRRLDWMISDQGVVYSPDGRYAAIFSYDHVVFNSRLMFDPVVIDLATGEMILTATYGNKMLVGPAGAVPTAAFSSDGRYLYYILYGNIQKYRTALYRYDFKNRETEFCYSGSHREYIPGLSETGNGSFVILRDAETKAANSGDGYKEPAGITYVTYKNGTWERKAFSFDWPQDQWKCKLLLSSPNSGYAFLPFSYSNYNGAYLFQVITPDEGCAGINQYYALSKNSNHAVSVTIEEKNALFAQDIAHNIPFQCILSSTLSPEGHYVLLLASDSTLEKESDYADKWNLYLLRLDDLSVKKVTGVKEPLFPYITVGALNSYKPSIEWNAETLRISTMDGILAYKFQ